MLQGLLWQKAIISSSVQAASVFRTIYAFAISPLISSGNLPTAARATAGCSAKTRLDFSWVDVIASC
jgi:hypothetical protein